MRIKSRVSALSVFLRDAFQTLRAKESEAGRVVCLQQVTDQIIVLPSRASA